MITTTTKNPISPIIKDRIPQFIKTLYPNFFRLLTDFYEWLETDENYIQVLTEFHAQQEVNREFEPYIDLILSELGWKFDGQMVAKKKFLALTLRDFYLSRGSANSFNYLFRLLYNKIANISYPRENLFVLSDANYTNDVTVLVTANNLGTKVYEQITSGRTLDASIRGVLSGTTLSINKIVPVIYDTNYLLIYIEETNLGFFPDEPVVISIESAQIFETIKNTLSISISNPGKYYKPNDIIYIAGAEIDGLVQIKSINPGNISGLTIVDGGSGYALNDSLLASGIDGTGFYGRVAGVDGSGTITEVTLLNSGYNYSELPTIIVNSENGTGAEITAQSTNIGSIKSLKFIDPFWIVGSSPSYSIISNNGTGASLSINSNSCIFRGVSSHKNTTGVLGINGILHDSDYYQEYSYELSTEINSSEYKSIVNDLLHPSGFVRFSVYDITDVLSINFEFNQIDPTIEWNVLGRTGETANCELEVSWANILFNTGQNSFVRLATYELNLEGITGEYAGINLDTYELILDMQTGEEADSSDITTYPFEE